VVRISDDEPQSCFIQGRQVGRREYSGVGDNYEIFDTVGSLEASITGRGVVVLADCSPNTQSGEGAWRGRSAVRRDRGIVPTLLAVSD